MGFCFNCGRQVRDDMRFCPGCGVGLTEDGASPGTPHQPINPAPVYAPNQPYPFPVYYRPPMSGKRVSTVAGVILLIIDGVLALLLALLAFVDLWDYWVGVILLVAGVMALISAVAALMSFDPRIILWGPIMLIIGAVAFAISEPFAVPVYVIGAVLAVISLALIVSGIKDSISRHQARRMGIHPSMAGYVQGMQWGGPPAYGGAEPPSMLNVRK